MIEMNSNTNQHFSTQKKNKRLKFQRAKKKQQQQVLFVLKYIHFYSIYTKSRDINNNNICVAIRINRKRN
jgi:hypothetical protein